MQVEYAVNNLADLIRELSEAGLSNLLSTFSSPQNPDVEHFLKASSVDFTKKSQSITYLVLSFDRELLGYFTLAIKPVTVPLKGFSNSQIKKLQRMNNINDGSDSITISAYLIAQLGKNYSLPKERRIDGTELLNLAYDKIDSIKHDIGGTAAFLECEENDFLLAFYARNNHIEFGRRKTTSTVKTRDSIDLRQLLKLL